MIYLKGNHESYAMQFLTDPAVLTEWQKVGAANTLRSYGLKPSNTSNAKTIATAFREAIPESHLRFLGGLALSFTCGDFFFTHAGVRPGIPLAKQTEQDLLCEPAKGAGSLSWLYHNDCRGCRHGYVVL